MNFILVAPTGTPDVELNLAMTGAGVQFEWVKRAEGKRTRWTSTWEKAFGE